MKLWIIISKIIDKHCSSTSSLSNYKYSWPISVLNFNLKEPCGMLVRISSLLKISSNDVLSNKPIDSNKFETSSNPGICVACFKRKIKQYPLKQPNWGSQTINFLLHTWKLPTVHISWKYIVFIQKRKVSIKNIKLKTNWKINLPSASFPKLTV